MTLTQKPKVHIQNPDNWLVNVIKKVNNSAIEQQVVTRSSNSLCVLCKGARFLCGKTRCPIMVKVNYFLKSAPLMETEDIAGMSPPSVFIGRIGYPNVYVGPLVPPVHEAFLIYLSIGSANPWMRSWVSVACLYVVNTELTYKNLLMPAK
jgi:hypothetical protein